MSKIPVSYLKIITSAVAECTLEPTGEAADALCGEYLSGALLTRRLIDQYGR